jgi:hypothetical protein
MSTESRPHAPTTRELTEPIENTGDHYLYGKVMPSTVPSSKEFWKHNWIDLVAMSRALGKPDFFVTLTANANWPEVKALLKNDVPYFRPVEMIRIFIKRFELINLTSLAQRVYLER